MKVKLICEQCGIEYEKDTRVLHDVNKYCSQKCYHASRVGTLRPDLYKRYAKTCPVCGKEFIVGGRSGKMKRAITCSMECQQDSRYRHGAKANVMEHDDVVYLAGFVDGEGSIFLTKRKGKASLRLAVVNTNKEVMDWIAEKTGISVIHNHGKVTQHSKKGYMWLVNSEAAESVIQQIQPYLIIKKVQAELALETQERLRDPALNADRVWQDEYIIRMKTLNARANSRYYV